VGTKIRHRRLRLAQAAIEVAISSALEAVSYALNN
jgi:hypothetical protein